LTLPNPLPTLTEARPSPIHGLGIFAKTDIPAGAVWWRAAPGDVLLINKGQYNALKRSVHSSVSAQLLDAIHTYSYYSAAEDALILILDNARYTNHSAQPNSGVSPEPGVIGSIALRDIRAGEDIVEDYTSFDHCPWEGFADNYWTPETKFD
jgi:hypothetical protein